MTADACLSRKITVLSIIAMIAVIFIHSTAYFTMANPAKWNVFAETIVTRSFSRWAVPFFFAVSGFWFGRGKFIQGGEGYGALLLKKGRTLLVPYLCWCVIGFLVALPLILGNNFLGHKGLWERTIIAIPGVWPKIDAFFGITYVGPKSNMPLWYVRSLLVLFLFAPTWRLIVRRSFGKWFLLAFALFNLFMYPIGTPYVSVPSSGLSWFAIGLVLAQFPIENWRVPNWLWIGSLLPYAVASIVVAMLVAGCIEAPNKEFLLGMLESGLIPLFGILIFWGLYDHTPLLQNISLPWCVRQTFFIYCLHEIVCSYLMAAAKLVIGKTDLVTFACTLTVPWIAFAVCAGVASCTRRTNSKFYCVICGGR